jgi:uncharacterized membrane protein
VALARSDISDTLPGVAIAISLVPPLAVVGLTLEAGATSEALGALLLFGTNVAAILLSGVVVMAIYKVSQRAQKTREHDHRRTGAVVLIVAAVLVLAVPLSVTSRTIALQSLQSTTINDVATTWAESAGWRVADVTSTSDGYTVLVRGSGTEPDTADLRAALDQHGLSGVTVVVELVPERRVELAPVGG